MAEEVKKRGRPTKEETERRTITEQVRRRLARRGELKKYVDHMFTIFYERNDTKAMIEINNRVDGKVAEQIEVLKVSKVVPSQAEEIEIREKFKNKEYRKELPEGIH